VGADIPNCGKDPIDELGRTMAMAHRNRNRDGWDGSATLRRSFSSLEDIGLD
jgi:hypothetical protein